MAIDIVVTEPQIINTRRYRRYKLDVPVRVIVHSEEKTRIIHGRGQELNEGGLAVNAGVELEVGDQVEVEFTPAYTGQPLRARAAVRNRNGYRYGLEFLNETGSDKERIQDIRVALQGVGQSVPN
ncbi:MAG TPA: PilZ domain-containing protein [Terriglobales bacterium]|nr:PilZ domain-containing protein [Terriglobales bacterium]